MLADEFPEYGIRGPLTLGGASATIHLLDGPTALEPPGADIPDRIPVAVRAPLVADLVVEEPAEWVDQER